MIVSRVPPSLFLGSIAACIHTSSYRCLVSTARRFFLSRRWEITVFVGDPSIDDAIRLLARASYPRRMRKCEVYNAHEAIAERINAGSSSSLHHDVESVFEDFQSIGVLHNLPQTIRYAGPSGTLILAVRICWDSQPSGPFDDALSACFY